MFEAVFSRNVNDVAVRVIDIIMWLFLSTSWRLLLFVEKDINQFCNFYERSFFVCIAKQLWLELVFAF